MKLSMASGIQWESPFVNGNNTAFNRHPQQDAHAYVLLYAHVVANRSYWVGANDLFTEPITKPGGDTYTATVPAETTIDYHTEHGDPDNVVVTIDDIETTQEELTLEFLNYNWQSRQVTVTIKNESPYHQYTTKTIEKDVRLPPRAATLVFQQLDELAGKLGFLAEAQSSLPTGGFKEVAEDA